MTGVNDKQPQQDEKRDHPADPQPVVRRADEIIMMASTKNAGQKGKADDHIQQLLDDLAIDAGELDQEK